MSSTPHARPPLPSPDEVASLPPDGGPNYNRLVFEQSPYLLQHAANPVDWWAWSTEAFEAARAQDKPIFLSIGYSTCHWCHVMEHESFEDDRAALALNDVFIPIKVDREERPDIDQIYMAVCQAMTGHGGWPLTAFLTPDAQPFFAGTYFPKESRGGRIGLMDLIQNVATAWKTQRDDLLDRASQIVGALTGMSEGAPGGEIPAGTLDVALGQLRSRFDKTNGGFGNRPKFPTPHNLSFLLRMWRLKGDADALAMVEKTISAMRAGGVFDHVGHGFHRYSTDAHWFLPHFEKMLYDQAMMAIAATELHAATGTETAARVVAEVLGYVLRDMTSPEGGFYSAEDADSEGVEGKFYVWTPEQVRDVLGENEAALWCQVYDIVEGGNFAEEASGVRTGESIPHLRRTVGDHAKQLGMDVAQLEARLETSRQKLFAAREARVHPLKDDKVLTDWNGLMIAALAMAGRHLPNGDQYAAAATRAADFVWNHLRDDRDRLQKRWRGGQSALHAVLDDYAFMAWGMLELYATTYEVKWLTRAAELMAQVDAHFADAINGAYFLGADDGERLITRSKEIYDGAVPSGNSVMAMVLARWALMTGDSTVDAKARRTLAAFSEQVRQAPMAHTMSMQALALLEHPGAQVVVVGNRGADDTMALLKAATTDWDPGRTVLLKDVTDEAATNRLSVLAPFTSEMKMLDGRAVAYVCKHWACDTPTTDVDALANALKVPSAG